MTFLTILYGAFLSRFHGGGFKGGVNKFLKNTLWALPFALCTAFAILPYVDYTTLGILTALSLLLCIGGKGTGHGGFMDLSRTTKNDNDERLEFLIKPLQGKISEYWYDFIGLALVGFAAVSGAVFTVVYFNPLVAAIIAIGGMLKSVAYAIGWTIYPKGNGKGIKNFDEATAIGEFLTGAFAFAGLGIVFNMLGVW